MRHRYQRLLFLAFALPLATCAPSRNEAALDPSARVAALADDAWNHLLAESPYLQHRQGLLVHELPDLTPEQAAADVAFARSLAARADAIPAAELPHPDLLTLECLRWDARMVIEAEPFYWLQFPVTPYVAGSRITGLHRILAEHPFASAEHAANYLHLLDEYGDLLDQLHAHLSGQMERGIFVARDALPGILGLLGAMRDGGARAALTVAPDRLARLEEPDPEVYAQQVAERIGQRIEPGYERLISLLDSEDYRANAPDEVGLAQYPDGEAYYRYLVRFHTTMDVTPEKLHRQGEEQVERLMREMASIRHELGFTGTQAEFHEMLRNDPRFLAAAPEEVEARYRSYIERIEPHIPEYFSTLPEAPYGVARLEPEAEASMTFGYYQQPTPEEPRGLYRYNGSKLDQRPMVFAGPLIYHELVPGHHFHIALQNENDALPIYRRENIAYSAFTEGWGNYAAALAREMGLLDDPYDRYGWAVFDMFISTRLVLDTGMNLMGWSLEQGRQYMRAHVIQSETEIASETLRYSTDLPGQALAYKAGLEELLSLRERARELAGDDFDIRRFHDAVLANGALPMQVLERHIEWYFDPQRSSDGSPSGRSM